MYLSVKGTYEDGQITLTERPEGVMNSPVIVIFLSETAEPDREELRQRFLAQLKRGMDFGDKPIPTREELYADRTEHLS